MSDNKCRGKYYRCLINPYMTHGSYVYSIKMYYLKRQSCPGCERCGWDEDTLREAIACQSLPIITNPEHRAIYKLTYINITTDWETGYSDGFDLEFKKVQEKS